MDAHSIARNTMFDTCIGGFDILQPLHSNTMYPFNWQAISFLNTYKYRTRYFRRVLCVPKEREAQKPHGERRYPSSTASTMYAWQTQLLHEALFYSCISTSKCSTNTDNRPPSQANLATGCLEVFFARSIDQKCDSSIWPGNADLGHAFFDLHCHQHIGIIQ